MCRRQATKELYTEVRKIPPTIYLKVIFTTLLITAHGVKAVHNFDVPGAYLHASLSGNKKVLIKFEG